MNIRAAIQITPGEAATLDLEALPEQLDGPGLVFVLKTGDVAALVLLSESTGLVPEWCASPDATGKSKLTTLAQELGMVLLPEEFMPEDFLAQRVSNLAEALRRGEVATGAGLIPLEITSEKKTGSLYLIWPAAKPADVLDPEPVAEEQAAEEPVAEDQAAEEPEVEQPVAAQQELEKSSPAPQPPSSPKQPRPRFRNFESGLQYLPRYSRSLLRITVPVVVKIVPFLQKAMKIFSPMLKIPRFSGSLIFVESANSVVRCDKNFTPSGESSS